MLSRGADLRFAANAHSAAFQTKAAAHAAYRVAHGGIGGGGGVVEQVAGILAVSLQLLNMHTNPLAGEQPFELDDVNQERCRGVAVGDCVHGHVNWTAGNLNAPSPRQADRS